MIIAREMQEAWTMLGLDAMLYDCLSIERQTERTGCVLTTERHVRLG